MIALVVVFVLFGLLGVIMLSMNALLGPRRAGAVKQTPFECGSPLLQKEAGPFSVKFSLVAILFLLLDVEAAFLFPWALIVRTAKGPAFLALAAYAAVLAAGLAYAWKKGAFVWD